MPSHTEHSFTSSAGCHHAKRIFHKINESREFQSGLATTEECRYTLIQQALCSVEFLMVWYRAVESESWSRSREDFQPEESESEGFSTWGVGVAESFNDSDSGQTFAHQLWLFVPKTCVSVILGNLSSFTLQQEMIMAIQTGGSALTCIPSLRGHSRSAASLGLITQPTLCECSRSGLVSLKFLFAHSGWHYCCSMTLVTQQWMRVLMGARLLCNARHRTVITPVNPPCLRLIHISPSYQTVYRSFEIILKWVLSIGLEFKSNVLCKPIASKKH